MGDALKLKHHNLKRSITQKTLSQTFKTYKKCRYGGRSKPQTPQRQTFNNPKSVTPNVHNLKKGEHRAI